ncbi:glucans biosynthesis glucosyltransferase MdoH [Flavisphingomonas formosensis]|uniref:glucans biosynthesis glucosyltransferase MdoH n=1 Tax=Flavisphingomonas formosensis TaxID=861534 RepID=UPI0012FA83E4|nr:glucans biosynthesis glucosyltransferase MdoH [Sphingomonas formosensis]
MSDFADYLRQCGLGAEEAKRLGSSMNGWDDLHAWMSRDDRSRIQPQPRRRSIVPPPLTISWKANIREGMRQGAAPEQPGRGWKAVVDYRRRVALALSLTMTGIMLTLSYAMLNAQQMPALTLKIYLLIYGVMTFFLASTFFKTMLGTWHMLRGPAANPWHPEHRACDPRPEARVAIIYPVYHEDVARVAAGMAATWASLERAHPELADHFDMFLLSDSRNPEYWIAEQAAIHRLAEAFPHGRFYYRRRSIRSNAKLGNVSDFCRRWGGDYDYMLVMDADSIMDGAAIATLLRMMEGNPEIGILQTNPKPVLRQSLFGRMQQFAAHLYGSVFSYSLQTMFMGHASYIGHNAMIRIAPFARHCMLPELSGPAPWGGKPLSHDIVESAMIARAGYEVWFLPEIDGSYDEIPANIIGFFARERRWMQGNLQHLRFVFLNGLSSVHRETFINGSMGYAAGPLWTAFLLVSAYGMIHFLQNGLMLLGNLRALEIPMLMLLLSSLVMLFLPRVIALGIHISRDRARLFGGKDKLVWSMLLETLFSFFFSPIMMIYLSYFMWLWLKRKSISWTTQQRDDEPLGWDACIRYFGWASLLGIACWGLLFYEVMQIPDYQGALLQLASDGWVRPHDLLIWYFPIFGGFAASIWIVRATSLTYPSIQARRLFTIPEETMMPEVVRETVAWNARLAALLPDVRDPEAVKRYAISDPYFYVRHRRETRPRPQIARQLLPKILSGALLEENELMLALGERSCFDSLHALNADIDETIVLKAAE